MPGVTWMSRLPPAWVVVAGISIMMPAYERAAGRSLITSPSMTVWRRTLCTSTIGVSPVTVTVSSSAPTRSSTLTWAVKLPTQLDAVAFEGIEAGQGDGQRVDAGPQVHDAVLAAAVGDDGADLFDQGGAAGFNRDAGQDGAGGVSDGSGDGGLGPRRGWQQDQGEHAHEPNC